MSPEMADFVAEVRDYGSEAARLDFSERFSTSALCRALTPGQLTHDIGYARHGLAVGGGLPTSFANLGRFWPQPGEAETLRVPHGALSRHPSHIQERRRC